MKTFSTTTAWALLLTVIFICGCSSIHSTAVKSLIAKEGEKLDAANQTATNFARATTLRIEALTNAVSSLNAAFKQQQTSELAHALIFSANQNIASKQGVDAHAVAYLIGSLYLIDQAGLENAVSDQFTQDVEALQQQARLIQQSWASLKILHQQIQGFANRSALASMDPAFVNAIAAEIPGASAEMDTVLKSAQKVNAALGTALTVGPLKTQGLEQSQTQISDLIDLLNRVKAVPAPKP